ncbi:MAG: hypothetical protein HYR75_01775 [Gemmatimonadetes bacterium]|nr:hypothetical protein [Gemmatimonadota bacterium]MBI3568437.1 hypothetical protein [Gemmatimonadota bacterium]
MTRRVAAVAFALLAALPAAARAQTSGFVNVSGPDGNPLVDGVAAFNVTTSGFQAAELPLKLTLQIATRADFGGALLADTTVTGSSATIVVPRLLPEHITIWWRVRAQTALGALVLSESTGPRTTSNWLTLLSPNGVLSTTVDTRQPTFTWSSARVQPPVQPWRYHLEVFRTATQASVISQVTPLTQATATLVLDANTSYRWQVTATLPTGDSITVKSQSTFVISDPNSPISTTLFQNFPNPFPNARTQVTCIWFDLRAVSEVSLDIYDIRGNHVKHILPGNGLVSSLAAARYGRAEVGSDTGCDPRLTWDGRADDGRFVPPGIYVIRFHGDGKTIQRLAVWKGH